VERADFVKEPAAEVGWVTSWFCNFQAPGHIFQTEFFVDNGQGQAARFVANGVHKHQHLQDWKHEEEIKRAIKQGIKLVKFFEMR